MAYICNHGLRRIGGLHPAGAGAATDDEYVDLQWHLALNPKAGAVIQETGGLRKVRWATGGGGKRGGVRVIYFHAMSQSQVRFLLIYRKGVKDDLSAAEKQILRKLNENW